jgi:hypothetical protein
VNLSEHDRVITVARGSEEDEEGSNKPDLKKRK